jgi:ABC-type amino acid transport substrate-binding protein
MVGADNSYIDQHILRSASELDYPPFAIVHPDGTAGGFSVDLLKAAAKAAGMSVTFKVGPWNEIKQELADKVLDVLPLVSYSKERDRLYDFSTPYLKLNGTVFVRKDNKDIRHLSDLKGKEVLVMQGDTAEEYVLREKLTDSIIQTASYERAFKLLASGKHDAVVVQQIVGLQIIKKLGITNIIPVEQKQISSLIPGDLKLDGFEQKFCFAVPEGDQQLLALLNEGLAIISLNGTYNTLYEKWFSPILPQQQVPVSQTIKQIISIIVPQLLLFTLLGLWYLNCLVAKRTRYLELEIEKRKLTEAALEEANTKFAKAQELGRVGNWKYNVKTHEIIGSPEAKKIPIQPALIVKETIKLLRASIPTTIAINQEVDIHCDHILADPTQIHQILMNLATNAFHAMEENGGTLSISLKNVIITHKDLITEPAVRPGNFVQLSIADTGMGIKPDLLEKIFEPYFTTKETGKGTGMGLAIIHGIVKNHGGFLTCKSRIAEGTVFCINLPSSDERNSPDANMAESISAGGERILLIDDEQMLAELGQTMLERHGYTVTVRMGSLDALATFESQPDAFDLVITDQKVASANIKGFALKPLSIKGITALIRKVLDE